MGGQATNTHDTWLSWAAAGNVQSTLNSSDSLAGRTGILDFFISRTKTNSGVPAYDLAYNFFLSQQDVTIHASPSVLAVNQTPAKINITDEISINTGSTIVDNNLERSSFERKQFGIFIEITPTIHENDEDDDIERSITLETAIVFDDEPPSSSASTSTSSNDQPKISRREIKNQVRVTDGETVILGGLRRKRAEDKKDALPFLGEIPGIGKLFAETHLTDSSFEMFMFITPRVVSESRDEKRYMLEESMKLRPGDSPEFLEKLLEARINEKRKLFSGGLQMLFRR